MTNDSKDKKDKSLMDKEDLITVSLVKKHIKNILLDSFKLIYDSSNNLYYTKGANVDKSILFVAFLKVMFESINRLNKDSILGVSLCAIEVNNKTRLFFYITPLDGLEVGYRIEGVMKEDKQEVKDLLILEKFLNRYAKEICDILNIDPKNKRLNHNILSIGNYSFSESETYCKSVELLKDRFETSVSQVKSMIEKEFLVKDFGNLVKNKSDSKEVCISSVVDFHKDINKNGKKLLKV